MSGVQPKVFRSTAGRVVAWVWLVFAAVNLVDVAVRGHDLAGMIAAAVLLLGSGTAYVFGLRPRIVADDSGISLHNPLRDVRVPWPAVQRIEAAESVRVHYEAEGGEERRAGAWAVQTSPRARARVQRRAHGRSRGATHDAVAEYARNRTPADYVAEQLTELAATRRRTDTASGAGPSVTWSMPAVAAVAAPAALLASLILVAVLT